jgi:hypothetical protein
LRFDGGEFDVALMDTGEDPGSATRLARHVQDRGAPSTAAAVAMVDTIELRWFTSGRLPLEIESWFTGVGTTGVVEERCDSYRMDGREATGVKRRSGETLELKVRRSVGERLVVESALAGRLERWRKWSPADGLVEDGTDGLWVDVHKSIVKRRFSIDGTEIAFSSAPQVTGAGCDVEVAAVTVGAVEGWTFAFAAFGPPATRRDALLASWQKLVAATRRPEPFEPRTGRAMSYPEWLALTISPDPAQPVDAASSGNDLADVDLGSGDRPLAPVLTFRRRHRPPTADSRASPR